MEYDNDFEYKFSMELCKSFNIDISKIKSNYCLLILKPECLLTGSAIEALKLVGEHGYYPVYIKLKKLCEEQVLELWKYGWSNASVSRILLNYITMCFNNCAIVILKSDRPFKDACVKLNSFKGPPFPSQKENDNTIRYKLKSQNNFLNFIHISDCTDDFIRELVILLSHNEIIELSDILKNNQSISLNDAKKILGPYLKNYSIGSPDEHFKNFVNDYSADKTHSTDKIVNINNAYSSKKISKELFFELISENEIYWSWENIIMLSEYTDYI